MKEGLSESVLRFLNYLELCSIFPKSFVILNVKHKYLQWSSCIGHVHIHQSLLMFLWAQTHLKWIQLFSVILPILKKYRGRSPDWVCKYSSKLSWIWVQSWRALWEGSAVHSPPTRGSCWQQLAPCISCTNKAFHVSITLPLIMTINHWQYYVDSNSNSLKSRLYISWFRVFCLSICCAFFFFFTLLPPPTPTPIFFHTLDIFFIYHGSELCVHNFIKEKKCESIHENKTLWQIILCGVKKMILENWKQPQQRDNVDNI